MTQSPSHPLPHARIFGVDEADSLVNEIVDFYDYTLELVSDPNIESSTLPHEI